MAVKAECSYGPSAWLLAMILPLVPVIGSSAGRHCRAFVPGHLPLCPSKLQLMCNNNERTRINAVVSAIGRPPLRHYRRSLDARGATGVASTAAAAAAAGVQELRLLTWMEATARIESDIEETGAAPVIVPVGATEQHGPNGLIGTDHMTAEAVARGVSEATGVLLAPSINYGMSSHHASFPGTVTLTPATFVGVVRDVASSLVKSGFTHVLFINGHGGNVGPAYKAFADFADLMAKRDDEQQQKHATAAAAAAAAAAGGNTNGVSSDDQSGSHEQRHGSARSGENVEAGSNDGAAGGTKPYPSGARLKLISWYAGRESSALAKELYGKDVGQHATPDEVAMTQHLFPASIKTGAFLDPAAVEVAKELGGFTKRTKDEETGLSVMDEEDFRRRFPDGRMFSNPGLATPEHGRRLLDAAVRDATEALGKFISGEDLVEDAAEAAKREAKAAEAAALKRRPRWRDQARGQRGRRRWGARGTEGSAHKVAGGAAGGGGTAGTG